MTNSTTHYENYFSFHWFYLQAISFTNTRFCWYFITMFLNIFSDPLKCWLYISLDVFLMVDSYDFSSGMRWSLSKYCSLDPTMQCTSVDDDWRSKETKRYVPTSTQLLEKTENHWLFFGSKIGHLSSKPSIVSQILSIMSTQQNRRITVIILKN